MNHHERLRAVFQRLEGDARRLAAEARAAADAAIAAAQAVGHDDPGWVEKVEPLLADAAAKFALSRAFVEQVQPQIDRERTRALAQRVPLPQPPRR